MSERQQFAIMVVHAVFLGFLVSTIIFLCFFEENKADEASSKMLVRNDETQEDTRVIVKKLSDKFIVKRFFAYGTCAAFFWVVYIIHIWWQNWLLLEDEEQ